jgi:hypothetical protein
LRLPRATSHEGLHSIAVHHVSSSQMTASKRLISRKESGLA